MRARLAVLAVAGLIAVLGVTAITASGTGHETEVRITAALAADGRIEFALQQREADEGWSERLLPRARFFPATVAAGRWLVSTPLTVRAPGDGDDAAGTEVRIVAQRLADGRTEFALQEREADDEWGERLLPRARFFPATVTVGRWLVSTPLTVSLPESEVSPDRAALIALYNATGGASWITGTNWLSDRPLDEWHGVTTDSDGRVAELVLSVQPVARGRSRPSWATSLTSNTLRPQRTTQLTGPDPGRAGRPHQPASQLNLGSAGQRQIDRADPGRSWATSPTWSQLNLGGNQLTGPIPAELGNLTNLSGLYLGE